jgi:single-strand DNA-binding protein
MNHIFIAGHLGSDPEVRFTSGGQKVTTLRVACNTRKAGKDETIWWKVTAWGEQFDKMMTYFKKGSPIMVTGELAKPEIFNDKEGRPQISMNITANHMMFNPFGRSEQKGDEGAAALRNNMKQDNSATHAPFTFADASPFQAPQMMYGQKEQNDFADEEIPF